MKNLIQAELLKLRTTRTFFWSAVAALVLVPISVATAIQTAGNEGAGPSLATTEGIRNVFAAASSATTVILIIGILMMAGEFRHNTAAATFLVTPDRRRVVGAKLIAGTLVGAGLAAVASLLTLAIAVPWLAAKDIHVSILSGDVGLVLLAAVVATALYALVGVGIGSLIRNQTAAVVVALLWVMVIESLLIVLLPSVGKWAPGGAAAALTAVATKDGGLLSMWAGGLLFAAYGLGFAATGSRFVLRRDVA